MKTKKNILFSIYSVLLICAGLIFGILAFKEESKKDVKEIFLYSYPNINGKIVPLQNLKGEKFTILNFWATWCAPCVEEMPMFSNFHKKNQSNGIKVIALAVDNKTQIKKFLKNHKISQPILIVGPQGSELTEFLGAKRNALPFTALIGPENKLLKIKMGKISENEIRSWIFNEFKEHLVN